MVLQLHLCLQNGNKLYWNSLLPGDHIRALPGRRLIPMGEKNQTGKPVLRLSALFGALLFGLACGLIPLDVFPAGLPVEEAPPVQSGGEPPAHAVEPHSEQLVDPTSTAPVDTGLLALWQDGPHLRGANIYQRRVYPELDGPEFLGSGPIGPPYSLDSFMQLADLGANYINISHPGLFSENPPYDLDKDVQDNLDQLLEWAQQADLFVVIAFRTGPGRSEFTFLSEDLGIWFDESYLNDTVWTNSEAQDAWVAMWEYTAGRYRGHPVLAGYDLMVEPNANEVLWDEWDPGVYQERAKGTLADWNQFYPRMAAAVRSVDTETPILVEPVGYGAVDWLPELQRSMLDNIVYTVHQYAPFQYTHQEPWETTFTFPGRFDTDWDGQADEFDNRWFDRLLKPLDVLQQEHGMVNAVNEFGVQRWTPGAADFLAAEIEAFESRGMNHAVWLWEVSWAPYVREVTAFQVRLGPDPEVSIESDDSELLPVLERFWARNRLRPSDFSTSQ